MKRAIFVVMAFVAMTLSTAFSSYNKPQTTIDSLSYAVGADIGLNINFGITDLQLDKDLVVKHFMEFIIYGNTESEEFMQDMEQLQRFQYDRFMPYMQAKIQQENSENGYSNIELPELYDEEFTREDIARCIGNSMGASILNADIDLELEFFYTGFNDALSLEFEEDIDGGLFLTMEEMQEVFATHSEQKQAEDEAAAEALYAINLEESEQWLSYVEQWHGVNKTESGLLYRIDRKGYGEQPTLDSDVVTVHYEGKLRTGEIFDSSYQRGEPISFPLDKVIDGWTEGMKYIAEGGQITLWIPAYLAYGERGAGDVIGPGEAIEFTVELLEVNPREE
ncbi:MAG: FKBP-type peptidyl-prolyl cis-trans isomerase [Alistipes sp.]|nr:FKBP-type peptidyl-prolyl cis-trans isomerase [Alistipes sp.]